VRDFAGHTAPVWMASFSPDGHAIVSAGADRALKIWDAGTGKVRLELAGNTAPVTTALFSPDGKVIASAGADKLVRLWDAATGQPLRTCEGHQAAITSLDFSPDGKRLLSGGADRSVRLWDTATGKALFSIEPGAVVAAVAFSPDGQQCAIGTIDHAIGLYDAATGKLQQRWLAHADAVTCLAYSPDGHYLASGGADGAVQLWLTAAPGAVAVRIPGHAGIVSMVAFRKDNQHLVSGGSDRLVKLWKIEGNAGKEVQTFRGHKDWVTSVAFSRDGERIVSASVDKLVKVWEIASRDLPFASEHTSTVDTVAFSPDNKLLATGSADHTIKLWDRATGAEIATLTGHTKGVRSLAFAPDSKTLISSGAEATLRLWEVAPPREIPRSPAQLQSFGHMPGPSPYLFVDSSGKKLFVWVPPGENEARGRSDVDCYDLRQGTKLFSFVDDNRLVHSLAFSANGKLAATGAEDDSVRLYDLEKQGTMLPGGDRFFFKKEGEKKPVGIADLALAPDGTTLIVTSNDGEVAIADVAKKTVRRSFKAHDGKIMACITSADGKRFATLGQDNVLKLWDLESGRELRRWALGKPAAAPVVHSLAFAADDRQLATGNANTTIYLLDLP
jgi:WD40 repeat protein